MQNLYRVYRALYKIHVTLQCIVVSALKKNIIQSHQKDWDHHLDFIIMALTPVPRQYILYPHMAISRSVIG
jgi:hypothetical protein